MTPRKRLYFWGGVVLAGLFLWLALRGMNLRQVAAGLAQARGAWVAAAVGVFLAGYACRIERWRLMLAQDNASLAWKQCAGPLMASVAANNVLPLRAGDLLRAFAFNRRLRIGAAASLTTLAIERLLDLLVVVSLLGLALAWFGVQSSRFFAVGGAALLAAAAVILAVLVFPLWLKAPVLGAAGFMARRFPVLGEKLQAQATQVFVTLTYASRGSIMARLLAWSVAAWLAEGLVFWFVALALPPVTHPAAAWLALPIGSLATALPSTPGYVGTFDYFTAQAMMVLGNPAAAATGYAFLVHAVLWLPATLVGWLYLLLNPIEPSSEAVSSST